MISYLRATIIQDISIYNVVLLNLRGSWLNFPQNRQVIFHDLHIFWPVGIFLHESKAIGYVMTLKLTMLIVHEFTSTVIAFKNPSHVSILVQIQIFWGTYLRASTSMQTLAFMKTFWFWVLASIWIKLPITSGVCSKHRSASKAIRRLDRRIHLAV